MTVSDPPPRAGVVALVARGIESYLRGDFPAALAAFDEAAGIDPASPEVLNNRGLTRRALGDLAGALDDFGRALALAPDYADAWGNRALALRDGGRMEEAVADLDRALALTRGEEAAAVLHVRASVHVARLDFAAAVADCDEAICLHPDFAAAHVSRAHARYHLRDPGAGDDYVRALEIAPDVATAEILRALVEHAWQDGAVVLSNCDKHLRFTPNDPVALARRGLTLLLLGREAEAAADLGRAAVLAGDRRAWLDRLVEAARPLRGVVPAAGAAVDALFCDTSDLYLPR